MRKLLITNRCEIAVRIARAAAELALPAVAGEGGMRVVRDRGKTCSN